jgi:hypothetical protein
MITKEAARIVVVDLNSAIEQVLQKHGMRSVGISTTYGAKFRYAIEMIPTKLIAPKTKLTQEEIEWGLAPAGSVVWIYDGQNAMCWIQARILKTALKKYVFEFAKYPEDGQYRAPFRSFKLTDPDKN